MTRGQSVATGIGTVTLMLAVTVLASSLVLDLTEALFNYFVYQNTLFGLTLGLVAIAAARAGTLNLGVWITTVAGFLLVLESATLIVAGALLSDQPGVFEALLRSEVAPADLPRHVAVVLILERGWLASLGGFLTLGLLLFPDGRLPSRRWWPVAASSALGIGLFTVANVIVGLPDSTVPFESSESGGGLLSLMETGLVLVGISVVGSLVSLFARYREADVEKRHQIRWMLFGAGVFAVSLIVAFAFSSASGDPAAANYATLVTMPLLIGAYGVGVVKYRLYDIDVVINRSLVFGSLAVFITGLYVAIVVGLGTLLGDTSNLGLAISATALVALVFEPVRARVQHWANVLVYGRRATPYEVLAGMSDVSGTPEEQLTEAVRLLGEGTGASEAVIWPTRSADGPIASWPPSADSAASEWDLEVPMFHEHEQVGMVAVKKRRGDQVSILDERLVTEFAGQASLLVANILLNQRLRQRLEELAESRRRLVSAQDETRRRLERDLHDGAQQQLVALKVKLGMAQAVAQQEGADAVVPVLEGIAIDADVAAETVRDLARGIYPPLLEAKGLVTAIEAQVNKAPLPVSVDAEGVGRYPREVEVAVYFCVLEALNNVFKYARADRAQIVLRDVGSSISFSVIDDGVGFDRSQTSLGTGLQGMADRLDTIGGTIEVESEPGEGTTVNGVLSVPETAAV